jgi:hypothetical protein
MFDLDRIHTGEGITVKGPGAYAADEYVTTGRYKEMAQARMDEAYRSDAIERYFTPGRIVDGYGGKDKVLQFDKGDGDWGVLVQRVDDTGKTIRGELPRWHSTSPSLKALEGALGPGPRAKTYTLDMPAGTKQRFMDWDEGFDAQPRAVQDLLANHPGVIGLEELDDLELPERTREVEES